MPSVDILCHQEKPLVTRMSFILLSHWLKGSHGIPQTSQAIVKAIDCWLEADGKALYLKTILPYIIEHGEVELVPD